MHLGKRQTQPKSSLSQKAAAMSKAKPPVADPKTLQVVRKPEQSEGQAYALTALKPSLNAGLVVDAYQGNIMGKDLEINELIQGLSNSMKRVKGGDLGGLEAMLVGQATALETIFTNLARRASTQDQLRHYESFMGMALKAQAQSRATIQAVIDLKFPRQATFVKQANIAQGPQQVNNGVASVPRAQTDGIQQNKLLEAQDGEFSGGVDTGTQAAAKRGDPAMAAMGQGNRATKRSR